MSAGGSGQEKTVCALAGLVYCDVMVRSDSGTLAGEIQERV